MSSKSVDTGGGAVWSRARGPFFIRTVLPFLRALKVQAGEEMRGAVLSHLSEGHRSRLSRAQEGLKDARGNFPSSAFVNVGDTIPVDHEAGFLRGHGTQLVNGQLLATVCGVVERVNKLVSVQPLRSRYNPETGDVVIGRITEVAPKRWKVDVNSRQDAQLMLSSVNLPGGVQRRRTTVDELNMRSLFEEKDLISAEVQSIHQDGSLHLHTRSLKYGKLQNGQLVSAAPYLIKRLRQHFHQLKQYGLEMIIGCNGNIWISAPSETATPEVSKRDGAGPTEEKQAIKSVSLELRKTICRFANAVRVLSTLGLYIHPDSIIDTYESSLLWNVEINDMMAPDFLLSIVEKELQRRVQKL